MRGNHSGNGIEPIICKRKTRYSVDYDVIWADESAEALFGPKDGGTIVREKKIYKVNVGGPLSRVWKLEHDGETVLTAERHGLRSAIEINGGKKPVKLERKHLLGSAFRLVDPDGVVAEYHKAKAITGKSEIEVLDVEAEFLILIFAFWLVTSIRRASSGNI